MTEELQRILRHRQYGNFNSQQAAPSHGRALDKLLPHKKAMEKHLNERMGELFSLDYDLLLYDLTSTYSRARRRATRWPSAAIRAITEAIASR